MPGQKQRRRVSDLSNIERPAPDRRECANHRYDLRCCRCSNLPRSANNTEFGSCRELPLRHKPELKRHAESKSPAIEILYRLIRRAIVSVAEKQIERIVPEYFRAVTMAFGGGMDVAVSKHFAVRPFQVDYNPTHFGGQWQSNFRFPAG